MENTDRSHEYSRFFTKDHSDENLEEIAREIIEYSFQKDAYQGHRIEGDYLIAYTVEKARWLKYSDAGVPHVSKPEDYNAYIGIAVHRRSNLHFVPNLTVFVTVIDEHGNVIGKQQHQYHARPGLHHYGMDWKLPGNGRYTLRVWIDGLDLGWSSRHEGESAHGIITVEFPHVFIQPGQQIS
jgi:hypothetical protein